jgi:hypothetical protein
MGDVTEVSSNVSLPEDVVYTQQVKDAENDSSAEEDKKTPKNHVENNSEGSESPPDELGRYIDVKV